MCDFCAPHSCDMFATASFTKRKCKYKLKYKYKYLVPCHYCDAFVNWIIDINCASISRKGDAIRPDKPETGLKENLLKKWNIWEIFQTKRNIWQIFQKIGNILTILELILFPPFLCCWHTRVLWVRPPDQNISNYDQMPITFIKIHLTKIYSILIRHQALIFV